MNDLPVEREAILRLEDAIRDMPQVEMRTEHHFADGMYARVMFAPKGTVIVGKIHKREHFFVLTKGSMKVTTDHGVQIIEAGAVLIGTPGTKRAGVALEDCIVMNVHRTKKRNIDKIEKQLIEPDTKALFDASNKLKEKVLPWHG
jgi:quercetin dioxygenase-like cupin family protein